MAYTPNAFDFTRPIDTDIAETAQLEFRTMKAFYSGIVGSRAAFSITNSVVPTQSFNVSVPASILSTIKKLRFTAWGSIINNTGGAQISSLAVTYGGGTLLGATLNIPGNGSFGFRLVCDLMNRNVTNSQASFGEINLYQTPSNAGTPNVVIVDAGGSNTLAVDTTIAQFFALLVTNGVASPNFTTNVDGHHLEWQN
jgi:hypothetical protein